jgi:hypothetical protein
MISGRSKGSKTETQPIFFKVSRDEIRKFIREHRETLEKTGGE